MKWAQWAAVVVVPVGLTLLAGLKDPWGVGFPVALLAAVGAVVAGLVLTRRCSSIREKLGGVVRRKVWWIFVLTAVASGVMCEVYLEDQKLLQEKELPIENAKPWQRGLVVRVYWSETVSEEMRKGLGYTVRSLGYSHVEVNSADEANFKVWIGSWKEGCKWPPAEGFSVLEEEPDERGSETGAVHICRMRAPLRWNRLSDYALMAHETAHVMAAQEHIGEGLMAKGGGDGSKSFNEMEIQAMCAKVNALPEPVRPTGKSPAAHTGMVDQQKGQVVPACGSEELRPMTPGGGD